MATNSGCFVALCILALFVQNAVSCCCGCDFPTSGGNFVVSSYSPTAPVGITICSENVYEGNLCVHGNLPLLGSAAVHGELGTSGFGEVCYTCGDSEVGIDSTSDNCCNKCGCNNAGGCCSNIGSCCCDLGDCCGNAGSLFNNVGVGFSNLGGCDFGSCCDDCRYGSINIGSCCCDLCSCGDNCRCGKFNIGCCCGNCGCDNVCCANNIALNIHPDCCFNLKPMWTIDASNIRLRSDFNIDNGPSSCCQCSNAGFNIDSGCNKCGCNNAGGCCSNIGSCNLSDCCGSGGNCQCSSNGLSSNSNVGCCNGFKNSKSFDLLKRFGLSGGWYPSNMHSSPFSRRLHELLHGSDCDCGCNCSGCGCSSF